MALRFASGFEGYNSSGNRTALDPDWDFTSGISTSQAGLTTSGRVGGRQAFTAESGVADPAVSGIILPVSGYSSDPKWICGLHHKFDGNNHLSFGSLLGMNAVFQFLNSEGVAMLTVYARGGTLSVRRGNSEGTVLGVASVNYHCNVSHFVECKVVFNETTGSVVLRVHEQQVLSLTNVNTTATGDTAPTQILFAATNNASEASGKRAYIDDLYVCDGVDGTGLTPAQVAANDDFLGDNGLKRFNPDADGSSEQFTLSTGTDSFALVDEDGPNDDTDYIESQTAGHVTLFEWETLTEVSAPTPAQVEAVILNSWAKKTDSGSRTFTHRVLSSTTGLDNAAIAPGTDYQFHQSIFTIDPDASARWDETSIDAVEAGVKVLS